MCEQVATAMFMHAKQHMRALAGVYNESVAHSGYSKSILQHSATRSTISSMQDYLINTD